MDKRLFSQIQPVKLYFWLSIALGGLAGLFLVAQAYFLSQTINDVFLEGQDLDGVSLWLAGLGLVAGLRLLASWGSGAAAHHVSGVVRYGIRDALVAHLFALGPAFSRRESSGELATTLTEGVEALDGYLSEYIPRLALAVLVPVTILLFVIPFDLLSAVVFLLTAPLIPLFMILIGSMAGRITRQRWDTLSRMSAHFLDVLQGLTALKLLGRSQAQVRTIRRISDHFRRSTLEVLRIAFLSALALELLATISVAIIAVEIGLRLLYGGIDFERALFILILAPEFYMPLRALGTSFHAGTEGKAAAERIFTILDAPVTQWGSQPAPAAPFSIAFESVTYRYEGNGHPAVEDVFFAMAPGELVALVGPSGAGKTTLASMLLGFIKPQGGTIRINGVPLADIDPASWRRQVAWVPQHPYLFNTSVLENIRLARPDASIEAVKHAAELAFAAEFIALLPDGYETVIGEHGARLSGGQAQRIALARAFLKDAPVLIMDEATSSLDPAQETLVQQAVARLVEDRTALVITHRLNTAYQADRIVVLAQGRVSQIGTHTVLRAQPGIYRSLVANYTGVEAGA